MKASEIRFVPGCKAVIQVNVSELLFEEEPIRDFVVVAADRSELESEVAELMDSIQKYRWMSDPYIVGFEVKYYCANGWEMNAPDIEAQREIAMLYRSMPDLDESLALPEHVQNGLLLPI